MRKPVLRPELGTIESVFPDRGYAFLMDQQGHAVHVSLGGERQVEPRSDGEAFFSELVEDEPPTVGTEVLFYRDDSQPKAPRGKAPHAHLWGLRPRWHKEQFRQATAPQLAKLVARFATSAA